MNKLNYRRDINGLRGIAVLAILIFHLEPLFLPGGFVGVDIFFVISGYLITKIIHNDLRENTFSLSTFYERRAKRILPALVSVLIICTLFAYSRFVSGELVMYAKSLIASALFSANIYFFSTLGYFSPAATEIPLLHLWSLGVEEQFYILFPLCMMLLSRKSFKFLTCILVIATLSSLILSQWFLKISPMAAFYMLPFRAFEFLLGSIIAIGCLPKIQANLLSFTTSTIGFVFIFTSIFLFTVNTKFPGFSACLPCLGTALLIWSGESKQNLANRMLSILPFQALGNISYSLYLVHWPIIVFVKRLYPEADFINYSLSVLGLSLSLACLNYYLVEQPFRRLKVLNPQKIFMPAAMITVLLSLSGWVAIHNKGFPKRIDKQLLTILNFIKYDFKPSFYYGTCFQDYNLAPDGVDVSKCLAKGANDKRVMLWGDSHSAHLYAGLKENLEKKGYSVGMLSASACPPIIGFDMAARPHCKRFNDLALSRILQVKPKLLILSADWATDENTLAMFEKTLHFLSKENMEIIILGKSPIFKLAVPILVYKQLVKNKKIKGTPAMLMSESLMIADEEIMFKHFGARRDVKYISLIKNICKQQSCPLITAEGVPVFFDVAHLTESGSKLYAKKLSPIILASLN
ncbi:MAG: acyltransferase [Tatlockia sp.]|nr:acyltransferase [Tatlockia sp.]